MIYKYHVVLIKEQVIIKDLYYQRDEKPSDEEFKKLANQYGADEVILNTIDDDVLESIIKEQIDINNI
ncbi:hypothetical protein [Methanosphaera sp. WGK6]|uniref:hypothetical protein n=1 Tax=Methanosphaera sp. WGK6 TaxID=1561964 RepID=UPI00084BFA09|nr:hypothetical protein [Methanosphaera sp. WGK6]OED30124.1 hypothetical protein NL43_04255 [Methanosphaera sp. WGK6]